jgi:hypothetical protein
MKVTLAEWLTLAHLIRLKVSSPPAGGQPTLLTLNTKGTPRKRDASLVPQILQFKYHFYDLILLHNNAEGIITRI